MAIVVKVQISIESTAPEALMLVYNKNRKVLYQAPATADVLIKMAGRLKAFFHAEIRNGIIILEEEVEWHTW